MQELFREFSLIKLKFGLWHIQWHVFNDFFDIWRIFRRVTSLFKSFRRFGGQYRTWLRRQFIYLTLLKFSPWILNYGISPSAKSHVTFRRHGTRVPWHGKSPSDAFFLFLRDMHATNVGWIVPYLKELLIKKSSGLQTRTATYYNGISSSAQQRGN